MGCAGHHISGEFIPLQYQGLLCAFVQDTTLPPTTAVQSTQMMLAFDWNRPPTQLLRRWEEGNPHDLDIRISSSRSLGLDTNQPCEVPFLRGTSVHLAMTSRKGQCLLLAVSPLVSDSLELSVPRFLVKFLWLNVASYKGVTTGRVICDRI